MNEQEAIHKEEEKKTSWSFNVSDELRRIECQLRALEGFFWSYDEEKNGGWIHARNAQDGVAEMLGVLADRVHKIGELRFSDLKF